MRWRVDGYPGDGVDFGGGLEAFLGADVETKEIGDDALSRFVCGLCRETAERLQSADIDH